jgi:GH15 family glucan-1,4-alpha-glucosidase
LGDEKHGRWLIAPRGEVRETRRRYRGDSLVLETEFHTEDGVVRVIDCMTPHSEAVDVVRVVEGVSGSVPMRTELVVRFDYGSVVPWVTQRNGDLRAIAGPDSLHLRTPIALEGHGLESVGEFTVKAGERVPFVMTFFPSHLPEPDPVDADLGIETSESWWSKWAAKSTYRGRYQSAVTRSLLTLKALTYAPTGGIVAAPTTSLPELIGGERNWDYRFCWVRDATVTLNALMIAGYKEEARAWREWLLRAVAGSPSQLQIMYGIAGERRLAESVADWLPGYAGSVPVRLGNAAHEQLQLDVFGELLDAMHMCRRVGLEAHESWNVESALLEFLESAWTEPDEGIWEVRGKRRHFTHSKIMAWVAFDRAITAVETFGRDGPVDRWKAIRNAIHQEVCERGFDASRNTFTQSYGSPCLDASLLMAPLVGFLPATDPRMVGTVDAIQRHLMRDGLVFRYDTSEGVDGLRGGEGAFLACSFWLVENLVKLGRRGEAQRLFEHLLELQNDVGLLSEEYDPVAQRQLGNFPQAFSHLTLVLGAHALSTAEAAREHRGSVAPPAE